MTSSRKGDTEKEGFPGGEPSLAHIFVAFLRLGLTAFGGPAMVAYIREMVVARRRWLDEDTFKDGVALVQAVPGATAMQAAAYAGLKAGGVRGALASYIGFGMPAFVLMLALSILYSHTRSLPAAVALFAGLQVIVVAIVAYATYTFGKEILKGWRAPFLAAAAGMLLFFGVSPFFVIIGAALAGIVLYANVDQARRRPSGPTPAASFKKGPVGLFVAVLGVAMLALFIFRRQLFYLAALMLRIDLFAFGGGFASLPLMLYEVVHVHGWMDSKTFINGIALGQVTPGPIVMTTTFVGYLVFGLAGAFVATAAVFSPSFLIIIAITPFYDRLKNTAWFVRATMGILASFVGLLGYVTVRFAMAAPWGPVQGLLALLALAALLKKVDILYVVLAGAALSVLLLR